MKNRLLTLVEESHSEEVRLEYPQYTRPREFRGMEVPEVLLSGNHQAVARWREEQSRARSQKGTQPIQSTSEAESEGDTREKPITSGGGDEAD